MTQSSESLNKLQPVKPDRADPTDQEVKTNRPKDTPLTIDVLHIEEMLDETIEDSFPASDPPSSNSRGTRSRSNKP